MKIISFSNYIKFKRGKLIKQIDDPTLNNKSLIRDLVIFFIITLILFFIRYPMQMSDFAVYYNTGERVLSGENIYNLDDKLEFKYLPITAIIFVGFTIIAPIGIAKVIWFFVNSLLAFYVIYKCIRLSNKHYSSKLFYFLFILFSLYLGREILLGQMNLLMIFMVIISIEFLLKGKEIKSGILLGLSIWIKPYTVIFLPYFLVNRNFKSFWIASAILLLGLVTPFAFAGVSGGIEWYDSYFRILGSTSNDLYKSIDNISIWSLYAKFINNLGLAKILALITILVVYSVFLFNVNNNKASNKENILADGAILLLLIPLFSPQGWFYQLIAGMLVLTQILVHFRQISNLEKALFLLSLLTIPLSLYDVSGKVISRVVGDYSILTISFLIIVYLHFKLRKTFLSD